MNIYGVLSLTTGKSCGKKGDETADVLDYASEVLSFLENKEISISAFEMAFIDKKKAVIEALIESDIPQRVKGFNK